MGTLACRCRFELFSEAVGSIHDRMDTIAGRYRAYVKMAKEATTWRMVVYFDRMLPRDQTGHELVETPSHAFRLVDAVEAAYDAKQTRILAVRKAQEILSEPQTPATDQTAPAAFSPRGIDPSPC